MQLTATAYFLIPYMAFLFLKNKSFIFYNLVFFSALTSISIINIGNGSSSITAFQFISLILFVKVLYSLLIRELKFNINISKSLFLFIVICGLSIFLVPYKGEFIVLSPNDIYENVKFSTQNITQFFYLLLGYIVYLMTYILMNNKVVDIQKTFKVFMFTFITIVILSLLQLIIPVESYNEVFRNTVYVNNQIFMGTVRISATNIEASVLTLFMAPLTFAFYYLFKETLKKRYLLLSVLGVGIGVLSNSSSFYFSIIVYLLISIIFIPIKKNITKKRIFAYYGLSILVILALILYKDLIIMGIQSLNEKLQGQNASGLGRGTAFKTHIDVFKQNILFGIGFGTTKSYDLFSCWLVQVGIVGLSQYLIFIINLIRKLILKRSIQTNLMSITILIANVIMFISVSEYAYHYIWIYYGIAEYLVRKKDTNCNSILKN